MQAETKGPIFLVGCPRSGTTLLQRMLDAHPAVAVAPETRFVQRFWVRREHYGDLAQDSNFRQLIEDIVSMPEFADMRLDAHDFREAAWSSTRNYLSIFHLLLEKFAINQGVQVVGEKTPDHLLYLETLQQFFPSARFIHLVRDPRAVVNSWRKVPWSTGLIVGDAMAWRNYMLAAQRYPASIKSAVFTLHYEQLVLAPEESLRAICRFVGLEFEPAMLTYHQKNSHTVNVEREPWKADSNRELNRNHVDSWQAQLSQSMVAEIEGVVWVEMRRLGYKFQTPLWYLLPKKAVRSVKRYMESHLLRLTK